jgi:hypothetical protein
MKKATMAAGNETSGLLDLPQSSFLMREGVALEETMSPSRILMSQTSPQQEREGQARPRQSSMRPSEHEKVSGYIVKLL